MSTSDYCSSAKEDENVRIFPNREPNGNPEDFSLLKGTEAACHYVLNDPKAILLVKAKVPRPRPSTPPPVARPRRNARAASAAAGSQRDLESSIAEKRRREHK